MINLTEIRSAIVTGQFDVNELEIIGDLAERIAKMAIQISDTDGKKDQYHELQHMTELVKDMLHGALDAFARMNIDDITTITTVGTVT